MHRRCAHAAVVGWSIFLTSAAGGAPARYWLADAGAFPGAIWEAGAGQAERLVHRRQPQADPAYPRAIMKVAAVAEGPDGALYLASGLDGAVLGLLDQRHEVLCFEADGQVRDLACGGEPHVVYYSVVPTPQNGAPLADGQIYRRDLWAGAPALVAEVRQAEVGGNWWGTFCVREGVVYLATTEDRSRLFRLTSTAPEPVFAANVRRIRGLDVDGEAFVVADGQEVARTTDFERFEPIGRGTVRATDVAVRRD